jgi:ATP-dependent DNA ligase
VDHRICPQDPADARFVLDGEAVILGVDGIADFNALHSRLHDHEVQFCAFDILV